MKSAPFSCIFPCACKARKRLSLMNIKKDCDTQPTDGQPRTGQPQTREPERDNPKQDSPKWDSPEQKTLNGTAPNRKDSPKRSFRCLDLQRKSAYNGNQFIQAI